MMCSMNPIEQACKIVGSQRALAGQLDISPATVNQWCSGDRPIPVDRCPAIERATQGTICCEDLRGDVSWYRVPDADWPHPNGRPMVDYAKLGSGETAPRMLEAA